MLHAGEGELAFSASTVLTPWGPVLAKCWRLAGPPGLAIWNVVQLLAKHRGTRPGLHSLVPEGPEAGRPALLHAFSRLFLECCPNVLSEVRV